jgi:hypothetical protein
MMIAVPLELVASPLKNGRDLGEAARSALVIGGTEKIRAGGAVVFVKVVAVAEARVKRDGQVRAKGSPVHHATLGPLEDKAGPGVAGGIAGRAPLGARFVKGERERLLARAFMIRVIVLMTLMPEARVQDVIAALAGDLALVPWARPWRPASARAAGDWRNALGPVPPERRMPWCGDHREKTAAEGRVAGRDAAAGPGHAREQGVLRHRGHQRRQRPVPVPAGAPADLLLVPGAVRDAARARRDGQGRIRAGPAR